MTKTTEQDLDERLEAWRERWKRKINADLFNNRKEELKALFQAKRWNKLHSSKLEGKLFRVKESHEINGCCPTCHRGYKHQQGLGYSEERYALGFYNEKLDHFGTHQINGLDNIKFVMPGTIVLATGFYVERVVLKDDDTLTDLDRHVEILTENAIGYIEYKTYLKPIKRSEIQRRLLTNQ